MDKGEGRNALIDRTPVVYCLKVFGSIGVLGRQQSHDKMMSVAQGMIGILIGNQDQEF